MIDRRTLLIQSVMVGLTVAIPKLSLAATSQKRQLSQKLRDFCSDVPKAELHIHLNSAIYPDVAMKLADKNKLAPLSFSSVDEFYKHPHCDPAPCRISSEELWTTFFATIDELMQTLRTADDVRDVVMQWVQRSAIPSHIKYAEITVAHPRFHDVPISLDDYSEGLQLAHQEAKEKHDIELKYIGSTFLYAGAEPGVEAVRDFIKYRDQVPLIGVTGFNESAVDITMKAPVYDLAREHGFRTPMHVGIGEPHALARMWDALNKMNIERIDHGYMDVFDDKLMDYIAERQIRMTSCPYEIAGGPTKFHRDDPYTSSDWGNFPFKTFYEKGILISPHSDIPAIGNFTLADTYLSLVEHYDFDEGDVTRWAENSFKLSFLSDPEKQNYLNQI